MCRLAIGLVLQPYMCKITLLYGTKHTSILTGRSFGILSSQRWLRSLGVMAMMGRCQFYCNLGRSERLLCDQVRAAFRLQHPTGVTRAASLAQIQEEGDGICIRPRARPAATVKHHIANLPPETRSVWCSSTPVRAVEPPRANDDFARERSLRDFRKANGLCFRCGDKYSREHKCKPAAQQLTIQVEDYGGNLIG